MFDVTYIDLVIGAAFSALLVIPMWKMFLRAGLSPYISIVVFLPYIGFLLVVTMLAFIPWKKPTLEEGNPNEY